MILTGICPILVCATKQTQQPIIYRTQLEAGTLPSCTGHTDIEALIFGMKPRQDTRTFRMRFQSRDPQSKSVFEHTIKIFAANHCADGVVIHQIQENALGQIELMEVSIVYKDSNRAHSK